MVFNPPLHRLSAFHLQYCSLVLLFQDNVVCWNCTLTKLHLSAFLDRNGQLSVEATFCTQELIMKKVACEQALRGDLVVGREKEGEFATTSLEFEYLHRKSRCEMLIGRDDISNDVITLGTCFSMFVYICTRFRFVLIGGNLIAQSKGSYRGTGGGIQIPEM